MSDKYLEAIACMDRDALLAEFKSVYANYLYWKDRCERKIFPPQNPGDAAPEGEHG